nr:AlpA family phage regulatory protein [Bradyrhizobium sp. 169]
MLNEEQVLRIIPVSRTTLYRMEKAGRFPRATYISPNRRVWFEDEIVAWQCAVDEGPNRAEPTKSSEITGQNGLDAKSCGPDARGLCVKSCGDVAAQPGRAHQSSAWRRGQ